jgi:hypothetical protein
VVYSVGLGISEHRLIVACVLWLHIIIRMVQNFSGRASARLDFAQNCAVIKNSYAYFKINENTSVI